MLFAARCTAQEYKRVTNLPHIYIETDKGAPITSKTVYIYSTMYYVDENDEVLKFDSMEIRGRGNSTWNMAKKPYKIKFAEKEKFLGKGYAKTKKWTLLANCGDKTLIRNAVTSEMGEWLGLDFNPAARFVDLTLNGTYMGNYQISDQVDVRPHRVNITEQDLPLTEESDITGGYLLEVDGFQDGNCFTTARGGVPIRIHYPDDEDIVDNQNNWIRNYMRDFETVLFGENFADKDKGYRAWVDSLSLANWYIATEVSGNIDGFYSTYFYKERQDSLLYWGPLWDYDIAYGNDTRKGDTSRQLMTDVGYGATKNWINRMWDDPWFAKLINRRYDEAVTGGMEAYLIHKIDSLTTLLQASQELNYAKWGINRKMYNERVLYSSYDQYITDLKDYIHVHMDYLLSAFKAKKPVESTPPFHPGDTYYHILSYNSGRAFDIVTSGSIPWSEDNPPVTDSKVCTWSNQEDRLSEDWKITAVGDYFMIQNRLGNLALADPTPGTATATTNTGTQLCVTTPDSEDERQLWIITPQGNNGQYNITNLYTQHTANLSGGENRDGASIISYTTDQRNTTSANRLWYILPSHPLPQEENIDEPSEPEQPDNPDTPDEPDNPDTPDNPDQPDTPDSEEEPDDPEVVGIEPLEYALAYNPVLQLLHFAGEEPSQLTFPVKIYSVDGKHIASFPASQAYSTAHLYQGIYIVSWRIGGKTCSVKIHLH